MPHNLYLHSSLVQTRKFDRSAAGIKQALKYNFIDSTIALNLAFFVNAAILILAAATFYKGGMLEVSDLEDAYHLLGSLLGSNLAPMYFGIALLCCGLNSAITATIAGQVVMEGFIDFKIQPWARRLITRGLAIIPAAAVIMIYGESKMGELLVGTQVILSLQLPFAVVPLVMFCASRKKMGALRSPLALTLVAGLIGAMIIALNIKMLTDIF